MMEQRASASPLLLLTRKKVRPLPALLDKSFPGIPSMDNKPTPYITPETVAYIVALAIDCITI